MADKKLELPLDGYSGPNEFEIEELDASANKSYEIIKAKLEAALKRVDELETAMGTLIAFCRTAPGRLPARVTNCESLLKKEAPGG